MTILILSTGTTFEASPICRAPRGCGVQLPDSSSPLPQLLYICTMKRFRLILFLLAVAFSLSAQNSDSLRVSILGDSYSTFEGWVQPDWNAVWYFPEPRDWQGDNNDVKLVEQTWWYQVIHDMGYILEKNNSFSGSTICYTGYKNTTGRHEDYSDRSFIGRAGDLGRPDIILVCGGTNDSWCEAQVGEYKWRKWANEDLYDFRPAMAKLCSELKDLYPHARIIFILNSELRDDIVESAHKVCKHYKVECVDLYDIEKQYGHPSIAGMKAFAVQVEAQLLK